jgi:hypothetical protein
MCPGVRAGSVTGYTVDLDSGRVQIARIDNRSGRSEGILGFALWEIKVIVLEGSKLQEMIVRRRDRIPGTLIKRGSHAGEMGLNASQVWV